MFIVKYYKCPIYKTVQAKIFNVAADGTIRDESDIFSIEKLDRNLNLYRVKRYIPIRCSRQSDIKNLNNSID